MIFLKRDSSCAHILFWYDCVCESHSYSSFMLSHYMVPMVCTSSKAGAALPLSTSLPNVLIIGDSVSIGYTPLVTKAMAKVALVQHSPYDVRDGGAEETAYGVQCLDYMLRSPGGVFLKPDVIMFNWGETERVSVFLLLVVVG